MLASGTGRDLAAKLSEVSRRHRQGVWLLFLLCTLFALCSFANLAGSNWFTHPDDAGNWIASKRYLDSGQLSTEQQPYQGFDYPVFTPPSHVDIGGNAVPVKAPGVYIFLALGHFLGEEGVFWIIPVFALLGLVYLYLLAKTLFGTSAAFLTLLLFGFSLPTIYWSNMLFGNVPALSLFLAGLYYLVRIGKGYNRNLVNYVLSPMFFSGAIWLRYEYSIFVALVVVAAVVAYRHQVIHSLGYCTLAFATFVILVCPILSVHSTLYGSPFAIGYLVGADTDTSSLGTDAQAGSPFGEASAGAKGIARRFMLQDLHPDFGRISRNVAKYVALICPVSLVFGAIGIASALRKGKPKHLRVLSVPLLLILLFWTYDTTGGYHWGENTWWVGSVYTRYLLIVYAILALYAGASLSCFLKAGTGRRFSRFLILLIAIQIVVINLPYLWVGGFGLDATTRQKQAFHELDVVARQLPENSVIVSGLYDKAIASRPVLNPMLVSDEENRQEITVGYIRTLLKLGYDVHVLEAEWHEATYLGVVSFIRDSHSGLVADRVDTTNRLLDLLYRVTFE